MIPRGRSKRINFNETPLKSVDKYMEYGFDRINDILYQTDKRTVYLPRTIDFHHLDLSIRDLVRDGELKLTLDGKDVPVIYMENDRWAEFSKTWMLMDDDNNIPTPYITIRRVGKAQGTRIDKPRVAQGKLFTYTEVPILDDGEVVYLLYKMPEPINIDLTYEINLFTKLRVDVNKFDKIMFKEYSSTQLYVKINGYPFPTSLESAEEANTMQDSLGDRFYVAKYEILLKGAIQDEDDFEIVKASRSPRFNITTRLRPDYYLYQ